MTPWFKVLIKFVDSMYSVSGGIENKKSVWEEDKIKAYALCPSFVDTAILGEEEKE